MDNLSISPLAEEYSYSLPNRVSDYKSESHDQSGLEASTCGRSATVSKFNMNHNPPYQIDFSASLSGKLIAFTKRRIRWRFGFSNSDAISNGHTGTECRGEEHEVSMV
jgi:hypothetical protein